MAQPGQQQHGQGQPAMIVMPHTAHTTASGSLHGHEQARHLFENDDKSRREFATWAKSHPDWLKSGESTSYKAPQHPHSHMLHTIPPRPASRSSKSKILSYVLSQLASVHLGPSYDCASLSAPASLFTRAESADAPDALSRAHAARARLQADAQASGLVRLGNALLRAAGGANALPDSVARRALLAAVANALLAGQSCASQPDALALGLAKDEERNAAHEDEVRSLVPLTAPSSTTIYTDEHEAAPAATSSATTAPPQASTSSGRPSRSTSTIARSLLDMKFGNTADGDDDAADVKPAPLTLDAIDEQQQDAGKKDGPVAAPHMDYRIVRGQAMRSRARQIYKDGVASLTASQWCKRHRVHACVLCVPREEGRAGFGIKNEDDVEMDTATSATATTTTQQQRDELLVERTRESSRRHLPGQGLSFSPSPAGVERGTTAQNSSALVSLVGDFLAFSAALLHDRRARTTEIRGALASGAQPSSAYVRALERQARDVPVHVAEPWYALLHLLLVNAALDGYLVHGWRGTDAIETLFGVGCGVWEGRGWDTRPARPPSTSQPSHDDQGDVEMSDDSCSTCSFSSSSADSSSSGDLSSDDEPAQPYTPPSLAADDAFFGMRPRSTAAKTARLLDAARELFQANGVAQAEYERTMRDRKYEFLNVPEGASLESHLSKLSAKYPRSAFERAMVDFLRAAARLLGDPTLARYDAIAEDRERNSSDLHHHRGGVKARVVEDRQLGDRSGTPVPGAISGSTAREADPHALDQFFTIASDDLYAASTMHGASSSAVARATAAAEAAAAAEEQGVSRAASDDEGDDDDQDVDVMDADEDGRALMGLLRDEMSSRGRGLKRSAPWA